MSWDGKEDKAVHRYLRAIGFSELHQKKQLDKLLRDIVSHPDVHYTALSSEGFEFAEFVRMYSPDFGIAVCGEYQDDDCFYMDYFYPVFYGNGISTNESIEVERHSGNESYAGICDDSRIGVTLIFHLQNVSDYLNKRLIYGNIFQNVSTTLSAMSLEGKVLLSISKDERQKERIEQDTRNRHHLIAAAREGDEDAIESLTLEDIDTYSMISRRVANEDILSIVDSYFMPYGIESDHYSILGQILEVNSVMNVNTKEEIYILNIDANDLIFDVCINKIDLFGEPLPGRRFKGNIWMQGNLNFPENT